ncbi:hypothetical protein P43SY_002064 [Pythium insidiosum]|uniref:Calcineurin-like phosphoesterase domain-containing protein n=1 Tax=Pythium insidiosum TaxID=114742 RepID=A0AAD5M265_PYTIN|nr:hypothetical protein P43SY_002064 [Pythium insidiosum]
MKPLIFAAVAAFIAGTALPLAGARNVKRILHFSDVHLNISSTFDDSQSQAFPIRYGQDAPLALLESALTYAQSVLPNPDFVLYTGDHVAHGDFTDEYIARAVETNVRVIEKYFPPNTTDMMETTAIIGNADGNPDYHMEVTDPDREVNPSIKLISKVWDDSLSPSNFAALNRRGYLRLPFDDKLVVLTLNTVPYSPSHVPNTSAMEDPFDQFAWLNATLADLRAQAKFAFIAGHIAPFVDSYGGNPQWHVHYIEKYRGIVSHYSDVIKAQVFGHVHSIEFRIPVDTTGQSSEDAMAMQSPVLVSGSISPLFGNNPSFMVWDMDADTYEVLDYTVYGTNISETAGEPLAWRPLFQASSAYGLESLSSSALKDLYARMEQDPSLLEDYYWNMKAQSHRLPPCTTAECRARILCTMKWWTTKGEYLACVSSASSLFTSTQRSAPTQGDALSPGDVATTIGVTVVASTVVIAFVVSVVGWLHRSGIVKTAEARRLEYENAFPML